MGPGDRFSRGALLLALAVLPFGGFSAREICIGSVSGAAATTIAVPISVSDGLDVAAFQVDARYDPALVTPLRARLGTDTQAAGGWSVDSQIIAPGLLRILGYSAVAVGLGSGFKQVALVDYVIGPGGAAGDNPLPLLTCLVGDPNAVSLPCTLCVQPGVVAAEPRFALSLVDDSFRFRPDRQFVEQGDWVLWRNAGSIQSHTSTSGPPCSADGLWSGALSPGQQFARLFQEPPGTIPYFCQPHCAIGETGEVVVTPPIHLSVSENLDVLVLGWDGGSGLYRVMRGDNPAFTGAGTGSFAPDAGESGRSFTDTAPAGMGGALFYLVTNKN